MHRKYNISIHISKEANLQNDELLQMVKKSLSEKEEIRELIYQALLKYYHTSLGDITIDVTEANTF